jgi:integrase/recombinase XerC
MLPMHGRFITYLSVEKRASVHTVTAYRIDLEQFQKYISEEFEHTGIESATSNMIRSWVVKLKDAGIASKSINRKITALRSFYNFYQKSNPGFINPASKINALKVKKQLPVFIPQESMNTIPDVPDGAYSFFELRDFLIIEVLYQTGMRRSELVNLRDKDIDFDRSVFKITGKGNKQRLVPFHTKLTALLETYIHERQKKFGNKHETLILTNKGKPATADFIYRTVNKRLKQITSLTKTSPHILRHTFATHLLNNGASLIAIRELLGHSNLAATEVYTHNTIDQLKKIHEQAHPKGH